MEALHDVVKAGKARYIGASSMYAWQFAKAQYIAERHGWTPFVSMQNHYNLLNREEEREMLPLCADQGSASSRGARSRAGRLTRDWDAETTPQPRPTSSARRLYRDRATAAIVEQVGADRRGARGAAGAGGAGVGGRQARRHRADHRRDQAAAPRRRRRRARRRR